MRGTTCEPRLPVYPPVIVGNAAPAGTLPLAPAGTTVPPPTIEPMTSPAVHAIKTRRIDVATESRRVSGAKLYATSATGFALARPRLHCYSDATSVACCLD